MTGRRPRASPRPGPAPPRRGCPLSDLRDKLRRVGLRPTRQRVSLGWLLFGKGDRHVTAEMLFEEASARPRAGLARDRLQHPAPVHRGRASCASSRSTAPRPISTPTRPSTTTSSSRSEGDARRRAGATASRSAHLPDAAAGHGDRRRRGDRPAAAQRRPERRLGATVHNLRILRREAKPSLEGRPMGRARGRGSGESVARSRLRHRRRTSLRTRGDARSGPERDG